MNMETQQCGGHAGKYTYNRCFFCCCCCDALVMKTVRSLLGESTFPGSPVPAEGSSTCLQGGLPEPAGRLVLQSAVALAFLQDVLRCAVPQVHESKTVLEMNFVTHRYWWSCIQRSVNGNG